MGTQDDDFDIKASYEELSANLMQPNRFAKIFCEAAKEQKTIDKVLRNIVKDLLKNDEQTNKIIVSIIRNIEKEDLKFYFKKLGYAGVALISSVSTALIIFILEKFIK